MSITLKPSPFFVISNSLGFPLNLIMQVLLVMFIWSFNEERPGDYLVWIVFIFIPILYICVLYIATYRYAFGSRVEISSSHLLIAYIDAFGLGRLLQTNIPIKHVKTIQKRRERKLWARGSQTFFFLKIIYDDGKEQSVSLRTWDKKNFNELWNQLQIIYPHIQFENAGVKIKKLVTL